MRIVFATILLCILGATTPVSAQSTSENEGVTNNRDCASNDIKFDQNNDAYFSEFRVSLESSNCPTKLSDLKEPILLKPNQQAQFWFRLQGSSRYIKSSTSSKPFIGRFFRKADGGFVKFSDITIRGIDRRRANAEANENNGRFDWRIWIRKKAFVKPGTYALAMYQNGRQVCLSQTGSPNKCSFEFTVTK